MVTRTRTVLALVVLVVAAAATAGASAGEAPRISAPVYVLRSSVDGTTLAARDARRRHAIASITKLMTVLVALERLPLGKAVTVPPEATRVGESSLYLRAGQRVTVRDLAIGALVPSANDAATTLAYAAGNGSVSRFVERMNAKARAIGLRRTRFANPHGLDQPGHYSTADDVARLARVALAQPFIRRWAGRETATIVGGRRVETTDDLLARLPELVGGKTGQTSDAGWSQVGVATRDGVTVTGVVLGAAAREARNADLEALLRFGLASYRRVLVVDPRRRYASSDPGWGLAPVGLVAERALVRPAHVSRSLVERVVAPRVLRLPVRRGDRLGEVRIFDGRRLVARAPLVADRDVAQPGIVARARFTLRRSAHHLAGLVS